jgi:hypothetical protein
MIKQLIKTQFLLAKTYELTQIFIYLHKIFSQAKK